MIKNENGTVAIFNSNTYNFNNDINYYLQFRQHLYRPQQGLHEPDEPPAPLPQPQPQPTLDQNQNHYHQEIQMADRWNSLRKRPKKRRIVRKNLIRKFNLVEANLNVDIFQKTKSFDNSWHRNKRIMFYSNCLPNTNLKFDRDGGRDSVIKKNIHRPPKSIPIIRGLISSDTKLVIKNSVNNFNSGNNSGNSIINNNVSGTTSDLHKRLVRQSVMENYFNSIWEKKSQKWDELMNKNKFSTGVIEPLDLSLVQPLTPTTPTIFSVEQSQQSQQSQIAQQEQQQSKQQLQQEQKQQLQRPHPPQQTQEEKRQQQQQKSQEKFVRPNDLITTSLRTRIKKNINIKPLVINNTDDYIIQMSMGKYLNFGIGNQIRKQLKLLTSTKTKKQQVDVIFRRPYDLNIGIYVEKSKHPINNRCVINYLFIVGKLSVSQPAPQPKPTQSFSSSLTTSSSAPSVDDVCLTEPFTIGCYHGLFPRISIGNEIFEPFVNEMLEIQQYGLPCSPIEGGLSINIPIKLKAIIVDPISNSLLTSTNLPASVGGCGRCKQQGIYDFNLDIVSYPLPLLEPYQLRTDNDFVLCTDKDYHIIPPIFNKLQIGLVSNVVLDYKHTICLGIMKTLLSLWISGPLDCRLNKLDINAIDRQLEKISELLPMEITEKPKLLKNLSNWTAYDLRQFLIYFGPIALERSMESRHYIHFIRLHILARYMLSPNTPYQFSHRCIWFLMSTFVFEFSNMYGTERIDYNVHNLLHYFEVFIQYHKNVKSIDDIGGFQFDSQLNKIKQIIEENETANLILEELSIKLNKTTTTTTSHNEQKLRTGNVGQQKEEIMCTKKLKDQSSEQRKPQRTTTDFYYVDENSNLHFNGFFISATYPNNYLITASKGIIRITNIITHSNNTISLVGQKFGRCHPWYSAPFCDFASWTVSELDEFVNVRISDIIAKGWRLDTTKGVYVMPLLNV